MIKNSVLAAVEFAIDAATEEFAPDFEVNLEARDILKQYCSVLEGLVAQVEAESFEASVDPLLMTVHVLIVSADFTVYKNNRPVRGLIERSINLTFATDEKGEKLYTMFTFPSIWEKC